MPYQSNSNAAVSPVNRYLIRVLVTACGLLLGLVWLLSSFTDLQTSTAWFPLPLHVVAEVFSIVVAEVDHCLGVRQAAHQHLPVS
ncbi:MAG: hypothetical protein B7Z23_00965, partial [Pseudomonadales bacterium 32-61-5]